MFYYLHVCLRSFQKYKLKKFDNNLLYCVFLPSYTWQCGLIYTGINLQKLQNKDLIITLKNSIRGGISSVMGDRYVKTDENEKIIYRDATNLYGHSASQVLHYDEIEMWHGDSDL